MIERMEKGGGNGSLLETDESSATAASSAPSAPGYEEMRRLNRLGVPPQQQQQHHPQQQQPQQQSSSDLPAAIDDRPKMDDIPPEERPMNRRMPIPKRNKYGDVIEED